jgi:hypothetical protein
VRGLIRRLHKLEAGLTDATGLVPHSEAWFDFYEARWASIVDDEGRLIGPKFDIPLAVVDRAIERCDREQGVRG